MTSRLLSPGIAAAFGAVVRMKNTILAGNSLRGPSTQGPDCFTQSASLTSQGYNLIQSTAACTSALSVMRTP